ncbi:MAG: HAD family hydrolase [Dehalococcoidia bacterium]
MVVTLHSKIPDKPRAIAFDCYKTLFSNSEQGWIQLFEEIINKQKIPLKPEIFWKKWKKYEVDFRKTRTDLGRPYNTPKFKSYQEAWTDCFEKVFEDINFNGDYIDSGKMASNHMSNKPVFDETIEVLDNLGKNYKLGLFSNADHEWILKLIKTHEIKFDFIASSELAQTYKPSLEAFEYLSNGLNESKKYIWYVGDHLYDDVLGGFRAGMTTVWINRNNEKITREPKPNIEITNLKEISEIINHIS